jgi:hypothetical protein
MSIRKITKQQFSEGTTVDGDRLDKALQDTGSYLNSISPGDSGVRYTQTQIVTGWTALQTVANENQAPWLRFHNTVGDVNGTGGEIAHPFRVKGTTTTGLTATPWAALGSPTYWVWTISMYFEAPCIVDALDMMWQTYTASYVTNINPQLNFFSPSAGDFLGDPDNSGIQLSVVVDDPQATEDPIRNSLVTQLKNVYMGAEATGTDPLVYAGPVDMVPSGWQMFPTDLWFQRKNMQVHIPANSRVSFVVALDGTAALAPQLDFQSYMRGSPNFVVTLLEPIQV